MESLSSACIGNDKNDLEIYDIEDRAAAEGLTSASHQFTIAMRRSPVAVRAACAARSFDRIDQSTYASVRRY